jgi:hypothetical protein
VLLVNCELNNLAKLMLVTSPHLLALLTLAMATLDEQMKNNHSIQCAFKLGTSQNVPVFKILIISTD